MVGSIQTVKKGTMTQKEILALVEDCYSRLDNIQSGLDEANETVKNVLSKLEEIPTEISDIDEEDKENEK